MSDIWRRWKSADPWYRLSLVAVVVLVTGALLPETWHIPGPSSGPATTTTSSTPGPDAFPFDAAGFLDRWNAVMSSEPGVGDLARSEYDVVGPGHVQLVFDRTDEGSSWVITLLLDRDTAQVTTVRAVAGLPVDEQALLGVGLAVLAIEIEDPDEGTRLYEDLLGQVGAEEADAFGEAESPNAHYTLALSVDTQFFLEATP